VESTSSLSANPDAAATAARLPTPLGPTLAHVMAALKAESAADLVYINVFSERVARVSKGEDLALITCIALNAAC
jgi:hypothetical protein